MKRRTLIGGGMAVAALGGAIALSVTSAGAGNNAGRALLPGLAPLPSDASSAAPAAAGSLRVAVAPAGLPIERKQAGTAGTPVLTSEIGSRIRTVNLTVAVKGAKNIAGRADRAESLVLAAGGDVDSDERSTGPDASAQLRLRVPPASLGRVVDALAALGTEVTRSATSRDVTAQVADVTSRVGSATRAIARLRLLYSHASKVGEIISIEDDLSSREADLESLQAQQRALSHQVEKATVVLDLQTASAVVTPPAPPRQGFVGGLQRGWHNFVAAATAVAGGIGTALPFLVLGLLVLGVLRLAWPRLAHRGAAGSAGNDPEPAT